MVEMCSIPDFKFSLMPYLINNITEWNLLKISKLRKEDWLPTTIHSGDGGADLRSSSLTPIVLKPFEYAKIPLGIKVFVPNGYFLDLRPRSSAFVKKKLNCLNGLIDFGFQEEMCFLCQFIPPPDVMNSVCTIEFGERVAQLVAKKKLDCTFNEISEEDLISLHSRSKTNRQGGFGSSGIM